MTFSRRPVARLNRGRIPSSNRDPGSPISYADLVAWWELPRIGESPDAYVGLVLPSFTNPDNLSTASGWTNDHVTVTEATGGSTPEGHAYNLITTTGGGGYARVYRPPSNVVASRSTVISWDVKGTGWALIFDGANRAWFNLATGALGSTAMAISAITPLGDGGYRISIANLVVGAPTLAICDGNGALGWSGAAGATMYATNSTVTQDGCIQSIYDRSGHGYHLTQNTFANMLWYLGQLEGTRVQKGLITGAPVAYQPGLTTASKMDVPAGLAAEIAAAPSEWELIALRKLSGAAATRILAYLSGTGSFSMQRTTNTNFGPQGSDGTHNDSFATTKATTTVGEELVQSESWTASNWREFFKTLPAGSMAEDAASPHSTVVVPPVGLTTGEFMRAYGTGRLDAFRGAALYKKRVADTARVYLFGGLKSRAGYDDLDLSLPTSYAGLLGWYRLPSIGEDPADFVALVLPSVTSPNDITNAAWGKQACTTPDAATIQCVNDGGVPAFHKIYQSVPNGVDGRLTTAVVEVAQGSLRYAEFRLGGAGVNAVIVDMQDLVVTSTGAGVVGTPTIVDNDGTYRIVTFTATATTALLQIFPNTDGTPAGSIFADTGTGTIKVRNSQFIQDGVIQTLYDQSGNNRHATQATFANMPYYMGDLSANWSSGAPTARSQAGSTAASIDLRIDASSGVFDGDGEVLALAKTNGPPTSGHGMFAMEGTTAYRRAMRSPVGGVGYQTLTTNNAAAAKTFTYTKVPAVEEIMMDESWDASTTQFRYGTPLQEDVSSPYLVAPGGPPFTFSYVRLLLGYGTTSDNIYDIREYVIFNRKIMTTERTNIAAGITARAA